MLILTDVLRDLLSSDILFLTSILVSSNFPLVIRINHFSRHSKFFPCLLIQRPEETKVTRWQSESSTSMKPLLSLLVEAFLSPEPITLGQCNCRLKRVCLPARMQVKGKQEKEFAAKVYLRSWHQVWRHR